MLPPEAQWQHHRARDVSAAGFSSFGEAEAGKSTSARSSTRGHVLDGEVPEDAVP